VDSREQIKAEQRRGGLLSRLRPGDGGAPPRIEPLLKSVREYNPRADVKEIQRAYTVAEASHEGQKRISGEDFIEHPIAVASVLADLHLDTTTIVAALLHDTVEDTDITLEAIEEDFGAEVARIVDGLTKLERIELKSREQEQAENVRKMVVAMAVSGAVAADTATSAAAAPLSRTQTSPPPSAQRRRAYSHIQRSTMPTAAWWRI
jgi:GTP pyrophosphokinase